MNPVWLIVAAVAIVWAADIAIPRRARRGSQTYRAVMVGALGLLALAYITLLT